MSDDCSYCGEDFGYDSDWDDIPKGDGHIEARFNPENEPGFVVEETRRYCDVDCLVADSDEHPFGDTDE